MKIVCLTRNDCAGSGQQFMTAMKEFGHETILASYKRNKFKYKVDFFLGTDDRIIKQTQALIDKADVVHFKGDHLPSYENFPMLRFSHKPVLITVGGSGFRRPESPIPDGNCLAWHDFDEYKNIGMLTALTPDLLYPGATDIWTPHLYRPIEIDYVLPSDKIVIAHSPSNRATKGTDTVFLPAIEILRKSGRNIEVMMIENVTNKTCLAMKAKAHIFFDQALIPAYGVSAVEAMAMGIPVVTRIGSRVRNYADFILGGEIEIPPFFFTESNAASAALAIEKLISIGFHQARDITMEYFHNVHSYDIGGKRLNKIYHTLASK